MRIDPAHPQRIGAIARATSLTPDAVRYYERVGLVPKPARTDGGFRMYPPDTVARLRFIRQAQKLGLELKEIRDLLAPANGRRREQCGRVRSVLAKHLADIDTRMRELEALMVQEGERAFSEGTNYENFRRFEDARKAYQNALRLLPSGHQLREKAQKRLRELGQ